APATRVPLYIAGAYTTIGLFVVVFAELAVAAAFGDAAAESALARVAQGLVFVIATGAVLLFLLSRSVAALAANERQLLNAALRYRRLIETVQQGLVLTSLEGQVLLVNDAMCE